MKFHVIQQPSKLRYWRILFTCNASGTQIQDTLVQCTGKMSFTRAFDLIKSEFKERGIIIQDIEEWSEELAKEEMSKREKEFKKEEESI